MKKKLVTAIGLLLTFLLVISLINLWSEFRKAPVDEKPLFSDHSRSQNRNQFLSNGCPKEEHQDWVIGKAIGCESSPNKKYVGKFVFNGLYDPDRYYELLVMEPGGFGEREVYSGDFRTLGWEWVGDESVKILYNCGTGCIATKIIGVDESISFADFKDGGMNSENGWSVEFSR